MNRNKIGKHFCIKNQPLDLGMSILEGYVPRETAHAVSLLEAVSDKMAFFLEWDEGGTMLAEAHGRGMVAMMPTKGRVSEQGIAANITSMAGVCGMAETVEDLKRMMSLLLEVDCTDEVSAGRKPRIGVAGRDVFLTYQKYLPLVYEILACPEYASNTARYDGIRYGKRGEGETLEEVYVNGRSEGFDLEAKKKIMLGNFLLSKEYYADYYENALRMREVLKREVKGAFVTYDAVLLQSPLPAVMVGAPVIALPQGGFLMAPWGEDEKLLQMVPIFQGKEAENG